MTLCAVEGCTNQKVSRSDNCIRHGAPKPTTKQCAEKHCDNIAVKAGFCQKHGDVRLCANAGCKTLARNGYDYCKKHGGARHCSKFGCTSNANDGFDFCKKHGGQTLCEIEGCTSPARGTFKKCLKHGGFVTCAVQSCEKAARDGRAFCTGHGGSRLCSYSGCTKQAQGASSACIEHEGGIRCSECNLVSVRYAGMLCYACRLGTDRLKQFEAEVIDMLNEWGLNWSHYDEAVPCAPQGCRKRPDFIFVLDGHVVILEVDEAFHRHYAVSCEISRIGQIKDLLKVPIMLIRFNPALRRYPALKECLESAIESADHADNPFGVHISYVGYPDRRVDEIDEIAEEELGQTFPSLRIECY